MDNTFRSDNLSNAANPTNETTEPSTSSGRTLRSSARVKAAKDKGKQKEETTEPRQTRAQANKRKGKQAAEDRPAKKSKRGNAGVTINEPTPDPKGKKRAIATGSDDEEGAEPEPKRTKYALRSSTTTSTMPKKNATNANSPAKAKAAAAAKNKQPAPPLPGSSRLREEEGEVEGDQMMMHGDETQEQDEHNDDAEFAGDEEHDEDDEDEAGIGPGSAAEVARGFAGLDAESAMAIFSDFRQLGSYMVSLSGRLKTMLQNIKPTADPTTRLLTLQELSELLSISTEDTLAGSFPIDEFVRALVRILGGSGRNTDEGDDQDGGEPHEQDEDAALAAALALSSGNQYAGDENLEAQVLAARCLANLMEALPGIAQTVSYHGAIPVLCSKLTEISYIDLAEQTLSTLEKISEEVPGHIVREGGLAALLTYLDFFSIAVQRTALQAAANCCRNISSDNFGMISAVWPIIRNCLGYSDQRLVEFACLCVIRTIDSYRSSPEHLESLFDEPLIIAVNQLLLPAGGSPLIAQGTFTQLLRALATAARASPPITVALLEAGIVDTLYQILTGVLPASTFSERTEQGSSTDGQGLGGGLADMTVMQNLAHRPKDQVEEALSLIAELLPPLPKDGVFDHKSYTEKSLARAAKAKAKAARHAAREANMATINVLMGLGPPVSGSPVTPSGAPSEAATPPPAEVDEDGVPVPAAPAKDAPAERLAVLRNKSAVVGRFMSHIVPILVDVYAASVTTSIRMKTLTGLLKAVSFLEPEGVKQVLMNVPVASFASSILSSKDHPSLMISALQLVELLLNKQPAEYKPAFRREGVFHEVEVLAHRALIVSKLKDKEKDKEKDAADETETPPPAPTPGGQIPSTLPGYKKLTQLAIDPEDAITLRARAIRLHHLGSSRENEDADSLFGTLRRIVARLAMPALSEKDATTAMSELASLFAHASTSVSSFELLQSGVVDGLLAFATDEDLTLSVERRQAILLSAFRGEPGPEFNETPLSVFVKKLQESLTRMESFDVVTVSPGSDESSKRASSPSLLARQLRLRLVADGADVPRNLSNIVVSIHAIATFQALHDYLRPRVSGMLVGSGARLSGMLAALAASRPGGSGLASGSALPPPVPEAGPSSSSAPPPPPVPTPAKTARRRSLRLSAKSALTDESGEEGAEPAEEPASASTSGEAGSSSAETGSSAAPAAAGPSEPAVSTAPSDTVVEDQPERDYEEYTDDEVDAEVFDDEVEEESGVTEKTVNLSVADDGSKVEAQTPDGTRVGTPAGAAALREPPSTPTPSSRAGPSSGPLSSPSKASAGDSYAAALKAKPQDWHLAFSMDEHALPLDLTIYGAIHQHEQRKKAAGTPSTPAHLLWQGVYTVKFKKVPGPAPPEDAEVPRARSPTPALPGDAPHAKILRLLRVVNKLSIHEAEHGRAVLPESAFVNNKLTAKLTRQLEEPMIVASQCLPDWALDLPTRFPFLFPFATRYSFVQSTSFGYARLILKWQSAQQRQEGNGSRRDDGVGFLGRLQRQKVRISRKHILESAMKVFELYGSSSSILEVEYFEEVGTGLGPTLEFYALVSREFARRDLKVWRDDDSNQPGVHVWHPRGLFPAPIMPEELAADGGAKKTHIVRVIGQFVAKALLDSRIIDVSFNKVFLRLALGQHVPLTIEYLKMVDVELAQSLEKLRVMAAQGPPARDKLTGRVEDSVQIEDLALDFTLPGYDIELRPGGRDLEVTADNVEEYIRDVIDAIIGEGARLQAKAFSEGFSKVFPIEDLTAFTIDELAMLFGNAEEDWSPETLQEALKADHGFNGDSRTIRNLIEIMSSYDAPTRRHFLQFITGSPKLPIGGFRGLNPALTVVRKPSEAPLTADDYLPSVMTCVNYLKLPDYSGREVMAERMRVAMLEGVGSFHLS